MSKLIFNLMEFLDDIGIYGNGLRLYLRTQKDIIKVFSNNEIISNLNFYIAFISMQDYEIYKEIGLLYPLFIFVFLDKIQLEPVMKYILYNTKQRKNLSTFEMNLCSLWDLVYDISLSSADINQYITKEIMYDMIMDNVKFKTYKYNYNTVVKMLIFTYLCKVDLARHINQNDSYNIVDNIFNTINNTRSIYTYIDKNQSYYPLFESSNITNAYMCKFYDIFSNNVKQLNPGYMWNHSNIFYIENCGYAETIMDKYFSFLYQNIRNGIVTTNILHWTFLFGRHIIDIDLLNILYSLIMAVSTDNTGLIYSLSAEHMDDVILEIQQKHKDIYSYNLLAKNINISDIYSELPTKIINDINTRPFNPSIFLKSQDICISSITFNESFFKYFLKFDPLHIKMAKIESNEICTKSDTQLLSLIKKYNSLSLINSEGNDFDIIDFNYNINTLNINAVCDISKYFDGLIIKLKILDITNKLNFIPSDRPDLFLQYTKFICEKINLTNIINCLVSKNTIDNVADKIKNNNFLSIIFSNFILTYNGNFVRN